MIYLKKLYLFFIKNNINNTENGFENHIHLYISINYPI